MGEQLRWAGFAVVLIVYAMFALGTPRVENPGEQSRLELAVSLSLGSASIDPVLEAYGTPFDRSHRDGRSYSDKAPGASFAALPLVASIGPLLPREEASALPAYWALRHVLVLLLIVLPSALFPFLALARYRGLSAARRVPVAVIFALCTPLFTYGIVFLSHALSGALATLAFALIVRPGAERQTPSPWAAGLAGLALAAAVSTEYPLVLFGVVLLPTMLLRRVPLRVVGAFLLGCLVGMVPCFVYHYLAFGSPLSTGYSFKSDPWHHIVHGKGLFGITLPTLKSLWGVLLSPQRGVFYFCPLLLLVPLGLRQIERSGRYRSLPYVALISLYVLFAAGFVDWQAGWSAAARHLVPGMMLSIYPVAAAVDWLAEQPRGRWVLVPLVAFSLTGTLLSVSLTSFFPEHFSSPLGQLVLPMLWQGFTAPMWLADGYLSARGVALLAAALLTGGATVWAVDGVIDGAAARRWVPPALLTCCALWVALVWGASPPVPEEHLAVQSQVLERLGYDKTEREARGVHVAPW